METQRLGFQAYWGAMKEEDFDERPLRSDLLNREFEDLHRRLRGLALRMNPDGLDLHFPAPLEVLGTDFETLAQTGSEALDITRQHWEHFRRAPYAADMFWYRYMLLVSAVSLARLNSPQPVPVDLVAPTGILSNLLEVSECMVQGGDSAKRCGEAIGNLLLTFTANELRRAVRNRAAKRDEVRDLLGWAMRQMEEVEARRTDGP